MPELSEIETVCRKINKYLVGKKIKEVTLDESDRYFYAFASAKEVKKHLLGARIKGTGRKGKYFWIVLDKKPWPMIHLGMSGNVIFVEPKLKTVRKQKGWEGARLWAEDDKKLQDKLWFSRLMIVTDEGTEMAIVDPRRFGRMWLTDDPLEHPKIKRLGYDPLINFPSVKILGEKLKRRKKAIKSVLLDQNLFAGVGNWLADEILFQARISPHHKASELTPIQIKSLHKSVLSVVKTAVSAEADYDHFPKTWLFHERWGKVKNSKTSKGKIVHEEIGGRTTAWVPTWQK